MDIMLYLYLTNLLLVHEYIHAINAMLFGRCQKIFNIVNYMNEVVWVVIREIILVPENILRDEKDYFNLYWRK